MKGRYYVESIAIGNITSNRMSVNCVVLGISFRQSISYIFTSLSFLHPKHIVAEYGLMLLIYI